MFNKLRGMFGEQSRRAAMKPDEPEKPRNLKNPNLDRWMEEAGKDGETNGVSHEFLAGDLHEKPTSKFEVISGGKAQEELVGAEEVSVVASEEVTDKVDLRQVELEEKVRMAQAKFESAQQELAVAQAELTSYESAKDKVRMAA